MITLPSNVAVGLNGSYFMPCQNEKVLFDNCGSCFSCGCFAVQFVWHKQAALIWNSNLKWPEGWGQCEESWQRRWSKDLTSPKSGIKRAARIRSADTSSQTHIKVSESHIQKMSCLPLLSAPHPPLSCLGTRAGCPKSSPGCTRLLWPSLQTTSVPSYSALSALYVEHKRLWLSPVSASDPHAECACRLILPHITPHPPVTCTFAGQSQSVCPYHLHWISRGRCWQLLGVFHSVESRQMQWEMGSADLM